MKSVSATELAKMGGDSSNIKSWSALPSYDQVVHRASLLRSGLDDLNNKNLSEAQVLGILEHERFHEDTTSFQSASTKVRLRKYRYSSLFAFFVCLLSILAINLLR